MSEAELLAFVQRNLEQARTTLKTARNATRAINRRKKRMREIGAEMDRHLCGEKEGEEGKA